MEYLQANTAGNPLNSGVLSNLASLYFAETLEKRNLQPEYEDTHATKKKNLDSLVTLFNTV